jgi:ribonuclease HI
MGVSMNKKQQKHYVVWKGRRTGIFDNWEECSAQVTGYQGAEYKSFDSLELARAAYDSTYNDHKGKKVASAWQDRLIQADPPLTPSYVVDASCIGVPGPVEYRGVKLETGEELFLKGPYQWGTNNIGEFLAIVHALELLKKAGLDSPIYSDSKNALLWVKAKKCRTNLARDHRNWELFELIAKAEKWLAENKYSNKILKWETDAWGENPADFGRK